MTTLLAVITRLLRRTPDQDGITCTRCGQHYPITPTRPAWRIPAYTCTPNCTLTTVDDTTALFAARVPGAWLWHLGADDTAELTDERLTQLDAQPQWTVTLRARPGGPALTTTRPLPETYAFQIVAQAARLGFTVLPAPCAAPDAAIPGAVAA